MSRMYEKAALLAGYPLLDLVRRRDVARRFKELLAIQDLARWEVELTQDQRLEAVIDHARATSAFYSERLRGIGAAGPIRTRLTDLPILHKTDIQEHGSRIVSRVFRADQLTPGRTGGSTGAPTHFFHDRRALDFIRAAVLRNARWAGYRLGDKVVRVSGSHFDYDRAKKARVAIANMVLRQRFLPAVRLQPEFIETELERLRAWKPGFLWGYASAIHAIAELTPRSDTLPSIRGVITTSDTLTDTMRARIAETFGTEVYNLYGTREFAIASECRLHRGLHINSDVVYIEVVGDDGQPLPIGETGRILVTDLVNYGFPFIRYEVGDTGALAPDPCQCGLPFPLLKTIEGRIGDFIKRADGTRIAAPAFTVLLSDLPMVKEYQIRQEADMGVTVLLVVRELLDTVAEGHLRNGMRSLLGDGIPLHLQIVDQIDYGESGKRRVVTSAVADAASIR